MEDDRKAVTVAEAKRNVTVIDRKNDSSISWKEVQDALRNMNTYMDVMWNVQ